MNYNEQTNEQLDQMCAEACGWDSVFIVKQGLYYRPNAAGYTASKADAWKLPKKEAKKYEMYAGRQDVPANEHVTLEACPSPMYSTDPAAAHGLLDKLKSEGWKWSAESSAHGIIVITSKGNSRRDALECDAQNPSFCRAVAICFLKTREEGK